MLKILISNAKTEETSSYCNILSSYTNFKLVKTYDAKSTIINYSKIEPDIFILDTSFKDIYYTEILDKISISPLEKKKCNTLLTVDSYEDLFILENTSKIYKLITKPINPKLLIETINSMREELHISELTLEEIRSLLLQLNFPLTSKGSYYMSLAILQSYYYPSYYYSLNDIFNKISNQCNVSPNFIREAIRSSLVRINKYGVSNTTNKLLNLLSTTNTITPKFFLDVIVTYFHEKKANTNRQF